MASSPAPGARAPGPARSVLDRVPARFRTLAPGPVVRAAARLPRSTPVTPQGRWVLAGTAAAWILGARYHWIEFSTVAAFGTLAFLGCLLFAVGRTEIAVEVRTEPRRLRIGRSGECTVVVTNTAKGRLLPVDLEIPVDGRPEPEPFRVPLLAPGATHPFDPFEVGAARRSVIRIGPATSVRGDPLGLVRRTVTWTGVTEILVHPEIVTLPASGVGRLHDLEGRSGETLSPSDLAFHALRDYVPGDDRRHIHWRSSARRRSLGSATGFVVRQFLETRRTHLLIIADGRLDAYRDEADLETAISAAASLAVCALDNDLETSVAICDQMVSDGTTREVLDACSRAQPHGLTLPGLVDRAVREAPQATAVVVVTGGRPSHADLLDTATRVPQTARTVLVRIDPDGRTGSSGTTPAILTITKLDDLYSLFSEGDIW